jgi:hypothetical protein
MIAGAHLLLYSKDPEADRAFFKTALEFPSMDLGEGWPPAELAVHPGDGEFVQMRAEHPMLGALLYLMCEAEWGVSTSVRLPSGGEVGLYQPTHPTMIEARST